jgi:demethoxyubiquinone hydroxylase (CLK1/Coq7/Cat5 family)
MLTLIPKANSFLRTISTQTRAFSAVADPRLKTTKS